MRLGVIVLPAPDVSERLIAYARAIAALASPLMVLGPAAPPHLTLAHLDAEDPAALWDLVSSAVPSSLGATTTGLAFRAMPPGDFYVPRGGVYVGLDVARHTAVESAHAGVLAAARTLGARILGGHTGEDFRPHVTLATLDRFPLGEVPLPADLVTTTFTGTLALGELGPMGTFPELLYP